MKVFISYAREDRSFAERIYYSLTTLKIDTWIDSKSILPGKRWKDEITRGLRNSDYIIILLSGKSVSKRGYCQSEILDALELLKQFPRDQAFIVPVRIEHCVPQDLQLHDLQWIDLFPDYEHGFFKLIEYFREQSPDIVTDEVLSSASIEYTPIDPRIYSPYHSFGDFCRFAFSQFPASCLGDSNQVAYYFNIDTTHKDVSLPDYLKDRYPERITIVVQNQYFGFKADNDGISVTLWFSKKKENIRMPYDAILQIYSPQLGLEIRRAGPMIPGLTESS